MSRKPVGIGVAALPGGQPAPAPSAMHVVYVVCDDGACFELKLATGAWIQLLPIPGSDIDPPTP